MAFVLAQSSESEQSLSAGDGLFHFKLSDFISDLKLVSQLSHGLNRFGWITRELLLKAAVTMLISVWECML